MLEHELIEMDVGGLDYSIRKKLDTRYLRDMAQLVDRVPQVKRLKAEKARMNKSKKERVAYIATKDNDLASDVKHNHVKENEFGLAELKPGPPYMCKLLTLANVKNPYEPKKSDKFPKKTYTFHVTKCDEIFDLLVVDG